MKVRKRLQKALINIEINLEECAREENPRLTQRRGQLYYTRNRQEEQTS